MTVVLVFAFFLDEDELDESGNVILELPRLEEVVGGVVDFLPVWADATSDLLDTPFTFLVDTRLALLDDLPRLVRVLVT